MRTGKLIANLLRKFGYEVEENVGKTGVVGVLKNGEGPVIGLRADIDANKIAETGDVPYKSQTEQRMHACGHDGHAATLLGAAKLIADEKAFNGTVVLVFQPAEEAGWGADAMIADGLMEKYGIQEFYGQHNFTYYPKGTMQIAVGPCMAAEDDFVIQIHGLGGHASAPHKTKDPITIGAEIVGYIELTSDFQIEFKRDMSYDDLMKVADELRQQYYFILDITLNTASKVNFDT